MSRETELLLIINALVICCEELLDALKQSPKHDLQIVMAMETKLDDIKRMLR